jgi:hypothetical protein
VVIGDITLAFSILIQNSDGKKPLLYQTEKLEIFCSVMECGGRGVEIA